MIINIVYLTIFFILIYVIYIAVKAINTGMQAKASNKLDNIKWYWPQDNKVKYKWWNYKLKITESEVITKEEFDKAKKVVR